MKTIKPPVPQCVEDDEWHPVFGSARSRFEAEVESEIDALMVVPREIEDEVLADVRDDLLRRELGRMLANAARPVVGMLSMTPLTLGLRRSLEFAAHVNVCRRWNRAREDAMTPTEPMEGGGIEHPGVQFNDPIGY